MNQCLAAGSIGPPRLNCTAQTMNKYFNVVLYRLCSTDNIFHDSCVDLQAIGFVLVLPCRTRISDFEFISGCQDIAEAAAVSPPRVPPPMVVAM